MQVGTSKDQGLYNKPSAAVHPGALATGYPTTIQYNTVQGTVMTGTFLTLNFFWGGGF